MMRRLLPGLVLVLLLGGCALTVDTVDVQYKPGDAPKPLAGAKSVTVNVTVVDARTSYRDRISSKKNGYGMEMAAIVSRRDVTAMVLDAVQIEMKRRGFSIGPGTVVVEAKVHKFYSDFKVGFFSGESVGEVILFVEVRGPEAKVFFGKAFKGEEEIGQVVLMGGENARKSIELAFAAAIQKIMADKQFHAAVIAAHAAGTAGGKDGKKRKSVPVS